MRFAPTGEEFLRNCEQSVDARRSHIDLTNLVGSFERCVEDQAAPGGSVYRTSAWRDLHRDAPSELELETPQGRVTQSSADSLRVLR